MVLEKSIQRNSLGTLVYNDQVVRSVFPTSYFGSIRYFQSICSAPSFSIEVKETFQKQSLRNRCRINSSNGIIDLSIPILKKDRSKTITEHIQIDDSKDWRSNHFKSIRSAYQASPFYDHYELEFKRMLEYNSTNLVEFNDNLTKEIAKLFGFELDLKHSSSFSLHSFPENVEIVDKHFGKTPLIAPYIQVFPRKDSFVESLSILDLLFCEGPLGRKLIESN